MPLTVSVARQARSDKIGAQQLVSNSVCFGIMDTMSQRHSIVYKTYAEWRQFMTCTRILTWAKLCKRSLFAHVLASVYAR